MSTSDVLIEFVQKELAQGRGTDIKPEDDLLANGVIDSLGILQLVQFVEQRFSFQIPDEDVVIDNFRSIAALTDYLEKTRAA
jgi:acyl carrier protein